MTFIVNGSHTYSLNNTYQDSGSVLKTWIYNTGFINFTEPSVVLTFRRVDGLGDFDPTGVDDLIVFIAECVPDCTSCTSLTDCRSCTGSPPARANRDPPAPPPAGAPGSPPSSSAAPASRSMRACARHCRRVCVTRSIAYVHNRKVYVKLTAHSDYVCTYVTRMYLYIVTRDEAKPFH